MELGFLELTFLLLFYFFLFPIDLPLKLLWFARATSLFFCNNPFKIKSTMEKKLAKVKINNGKKSTMQKCTNHP